MTRGVITRGNSKRERIMGRPQKLTEELLARIVETLRLTANISVAAARAGVEKHTLYKWRSRGSEESDDSDIYRRLWLETETARADFILEGAATFHKYSKGGLIVEPKRRVVYDNLGRPHELRELERDEDGKIVEEEQFISPDLKQIAWELSRIDPVSYPSPGIINNISNTNQVVNNRISLVEVLELIGPIPDDDAPLLPKENNGMATWTNTSGIAVDDAEEINVPLPVGDDDKAEGRRRRP
jgi:hypothetical protein